MYLICYLNSASFFVSVLFVFLVKVYSLVFLVPLNLYTLHSNFACLVYSIVSIFWISKNLIVVLLLLLILFKFLFVFLLIIYNLQVLEAYSSPFVFQFSYILIYISWVYFKYSISACSIFYFLNWSFECSRFVHCEIRLSPQQNDNFSKFVIWGAD